MNSLIVSEAAIEQMQVVLIAVGRRVAAVAQRIRISGPLLYSSRSMYRAACLVKSAPIQ